MTRRRGFALLAVLWVIVALTALGVSLSLIARQALGAARNRIELTRAEWRAEGCMAQMRASIEVYLTSPPRVDAHGLSGWSALDQLAAADALRIGECEITFRAAGSRLDVNAADEQILETLLTGLRIEAPRRDSMVAALLDWRDADDDVRDAGAERAWYVHAGRALPRNGNIADVAELRRIRGFEHIALDSVLDVEPGRVDLNHAPLVVIASLPGLGDEAISRISEMRYERIPVSDLSTFSGTLSPGARQQLLGSFAELSRLTTTEPDAWIVTARASAGTPMVSAVVELRIVRAGVRTAIVRRRTGVV
ncbi:MAG: hypothetical protein ABI446_04460 [Gemmatimonadaceae bacterium]